MTNPEHLKILNQGVEVWNRWRKENPEIRPDCRGAVDSLADIEARHINCNADLSEAALRRDVEEWFEWAQRIPEIAKDLVGADLHGANLRTADLHCARLNLADLSKADLSRANLKSADLRESNVKEANLSCADLSSADLRSANLSAVDLSGAKLGGANLRKANLNRAHLNDADLCGADLGAANLQATEFLNARLSEANLTDADLNVADLGSADLRGANLRGANLTLAELLGTDLTGADLRGADLHNAKLIACNLTDASLAQAELEYTTLADIDLRGVAGLGSVKHGGPSPVSTSTLERSRGQRIPEAFLRGCGLADWEIEAAKLYSRELTEEERTDITYEILRIQGESPLQINRLFISYSHANTPFVEALAKRFDEKHIRYWLDIKDLKAGRLETQIDRAIQLNPTVLLMLSEKSVESDWVEWEVARARKLEKDLGRDVLCPITLDDAWETCDWPGPLRRQIKDYHVLDFSDWEDPVAFDRQFKKLIDGLGLFYPKASG